MGECSPESRQQLVATLRSCLPGYTIWAVQASRLRGEYRVAAPRMANRVWKRSAEYGLILQERRRLPRG